MTPDTHISQLPESSLAQTVMFPDRLPLGVEITEQTVIGNMTRCSVSAGYRRNLYTVRFTMDVDSQRHYHKMCPDSDDIHLTCETSKDGQRFLAQYQQDPYSPEYAILIAMLSKRDDVNSPYSILKPWEEYQAIQYLGYQKPPRFIDLARSAFMVLNRLDPDTQKPIPFDRASLNPLIKAPYWYRYRKSVNF